MGLVFQTTPGARRAYLEETIKWSKALIEPGKDEAQVKLAPLSANEAELIILKLDQLAMDAQHEGIAKMIAEEIESILVLIRMVKAETKAAFAGILGAGSNLDVMWLRAKDVGGTLLNPAATASKGLYGGTSGGVFTWLHAFTANTSDDLVPEQRMADEAGVIHLGFLDSIEIPKVNAFRPTLAAIPAPAQSLAFNIRERGGLDQTPFARLEKPIIVGPRQTQKIDVMPNITGDSKLELLSLLVAEAQNLTL